MVLPIINLVTFAAGEPDLKSGITIKYSRIRLGFPSAGTPGTWSVHTCSLWNSSHWLGVTSPWPSPSQQPRAGEDGGDEL